MLPFLQLTRLPSFPRIPADRKIHLNKLRCVWISIWRLNPPSRQDTTLSDQGGKAWEVFRHRPHYFVCKTLVLETFIHVVKKTSSQQRMMEKHRARTGGDF